MNAHKILFPTDFSPASQEALKWATSLARDTGASITIVHVEEPPMAYGGGEMYVGDGEGHREELKKSLVEVVPADSSIHFEHKLLIGDPANAIVQTAEDEHADFIVIGTHGRTGLTRLLMGSVAEAVVRHAKCPVLTIKQPVGVEAHA
jgi:nucleotide-binding universal stress UspA family protein